MVNLVLRSDRPLKSIRSSLGGTDADTDGQARPLFDAMPDLLAIIDEIP